MTLNTGDNPALGKGLLRAAAEYCMRNGHRLMDTVGADRVNVYSYVMHSGLPAELRYYLVARGDPMHTQTGDVVSIQNFLHKLAQNPMRPIVMRITWLISNRHTWHVYHPGILYYKGIGQNSRMGVMMYNFHYKDGIEIRYLKDIGKAWEQLRKKWEVMQQKSKNQTSLGRFIAT